MSLPASNTSSTTGRGRHHWWLAVAGVALVVAGLVAWFTQEPGAGTSDRTLGAHVPGAVSAASSHEATRSRWVPGAPRRVIIPALEVDAPVLPIKAPGGELIPPGDPQQLGWWAGGALPGASRGSALVTGHTVHTGGGALDDLETLQRGDEVTVRTDRGRIRYVVRRVAVYSKGRVAEDAQQLFSQEVPGRLVLVTCEDWDGAQYLSNVVVIATAVGSR